MNRTTQGVEMEAKAAGMLFLIGLLLPLLLACSGSNKYESEIEGWTAVQLFEGDSSETWLGTMEDPNYPDISMPILYTPNSTNRYGIGSVDHSQASALGAYIYSLRKEKGEPRLDPKFLETHNGVFVIRQFTESDETEPFPQEWISGFKEQVCRISNEVFGGLPVTVIIYQYPEGIRKAGSYKYTDLAVFVMEGAQTDVWVEATCGEAIVKKSGTKPSSSESSSKAESQIPPTPITVEVVDTAGNILDLYESNEVGAEVSYTGKWAEITGKIERIEPKGGRIEVNLVGLQDLFPLASLVCKIPQGRTSAAAQLRKGDVISIRGKILGVPGVSNVVVEPCELHQGGSTQPATSSTPLPPLPASQTDTTVEVVDYVGNILDLYQSNKIAAGVNYTGKWAEITGKIERIEPKGGRIEVNLVGLQDLFPIATLVCKISQGETSIVAQLRKGDTISIRGKILGVPGVSNVVVEPCYLK